MPSEPQPLIAPNEPESRHAGDIEVLALAGSLRHDSFNRRLLAAARDQAPPGMRVTLYDDLASVPLFNEDLDEATPGGPEGVQRLRSAVGACDGLLIATPEYNQSVPGVLKNAIDWLSLDRPSAVLANKPVALMGATPGPWGTRLAQRTLRQVLFATESLILTGPPIYLRSVNELFDSDGSMTDRGTLQRLEALLTAFGEWIELTSPELAAKRRRVS